MKGIRGMEGAGEITFNYQPETWDQERFLSLGGFVVVFLNYNKKEQIRKAVLSALNQDFPLLEMLFMDDASTDGSGDMMEEIVRSSSQGGRHKVMVVRNTVNQYITGQWNIAARLSTGNWLGMFCGDDFARPDRVSRMAEIIKRTPSLLGACTAASTWDVATGKCLGISKTGQSYFALGTDSLEMLNASFCTLGATAFWNRRLFKRPLPRIPMDDTFLHYRCYLLGRGCPNPVWAYVTDVVSVDYTFGTGVTTSAVRRKSDTPIQRWLFGVRKRKHFMGKMINPTMHALIQESREMELPVEYRRYFRMKEVSTNWDASGTVMRILKMPSLIYSVCATGFSRKYLLGTFRWAIKSLIREFLGLHLSALICVGLLGHKCTRDVNGIKA